jgi:hypothetical protein
MRVVSVAENPMSGLVQLPGSTVYVIKVSGGSVRFGATTTTLATSGNRL